MQSVAPNSTWTYLADTVFENVGEDEPVAMYQPTDQELKLLKGTIEWEELKLEQRVNELSDDDSF